MLFDFTIPYKCQWKDGADYSYRKTYTYTVTTAPSGWCGSAVRFRSLEKQAIRDISKLNGKLTTHCRPITGNRPMTVQAE